MKDSANTDLTFILADCDYPYSLGKVGPYLLWKMYNKSLLIYINIIFSDNIGTESESSSLPYIPPHPERGSGVHRIVAVLLKGPLIRVSYRE